MEDTDYGRSNTNAVRAAFSKIDGFKDIDLSMEEYLPIGHTDFYPQLNKAKKNNVDFVVSCFTSPASGSAFVRQYKEVGLTAPCIGIFYGALPEFKEQVGKFSEGLLWCSAYIPDMEKTAPEVAAKYKQQYGKVLSLDGIWGYDVGGLLTQNIEKAGSADPDKLRPVMLETSYKGFLGTYAYNPETHAVKDGPEYLPIAYRQVQDGQGCLCMARFVEDWRFRCFILD